MKCRFGRMVRAAYSGKRTLLRCRSYRWPARDFVVPERRQQGDMVGHGLHDRVHGGAICTHALHGIATLNEKNVVALDNDQPLGTSAPRPPPPLQPHPLPSFLPSFLFIGVTVKQSARLIFYGRWLPRSRRNYTYSMPSSPARPGSLPLSCAEAVSDLYITGWQHSPLSPSSPSSRARFLGCLSG